MSNYLSYLYLLSPLHTGGSAQEGNLMGIAREVHTEFPYLPSSSLRGKVRSVMERVSPEEAGPFFGERIKDGGQPTEGEVWFSDATLLFFPIASLSHHLVWVTCPLWLSRWNRWLPGTPLSAFIRQCHDTLAGGVSALVTFSTSELFLQGALLRETDVNKPNDLSALQSAIEAITKNEDGFLTQLGRKLVILTDEDCAALVETGLQREVRVALKQDEKTVQGGSFRSEEAIPPEAVLFFPWGMKAHRQQDDTQNIRKKIVPILNDRLQFGGLEGLGRGWAQLTSIEISTTKTEG
jgi:CRISPR-associated protein Cmr4